MKDLFFITSIAALLTSCGTYRIFDLNLLAFGMTKREVINTAGKPDCVLAERQTKNGYQELLKYNNAYNEYFAFEFWYNYMTGYKFLYEDITYTYVPPVYPPTYYPDCGKLVYVYPSSLPRPGTPATPNGPGTLLTDKPSNVSIPSASSFEKEFSHTNIIYQTSHAFQVQALEVQYAKATQQTNGKQQEAQVEYSRKEKINTILRIIN
jgi:hypothetical protein